MPYLNLDLNYLTNVKTRRLVCQLGRGSEMLPIRLWCHCASHHAEDGVLAGYSVEEIEFILEWKGARGKAVATLVKVGFLDTVERGFRVHNWMAHEGHISEFKRRSRIANATRWKNPVALAEAQNLPGLKSPSEECESDSTSPSDAMNTPNTPSDRTRTLSTAPSGETRQPSGTPCNETRNPSGTPCNGTRTPSGETRTPSRTPSGETRTPTQTHSGETWSPPTKPTNITSPTNTTGPTGTHTSAPSVFTYPNLSNQTTPRQGGNLYADEPAVGRIEDSIRQEISQRMGSSADLSDVDVKTMVVLAKIHGLAFQKACEHLRPGVKNIVGYIRSLLDFPEVAACRSASRRIPSS
jgi:hypothetical protein